MRLIDADKVIENLEAIKKDNPNFIDMAHTIGFMSMINKQPTSYDVDEVIKRLKKLRDCKYLTGIINNDYEFGACDALNDAIKIIKAGGNIELSEHSESQGNRTGKQKATIEAESKAE